MKEQPTVTKNYLNYSAKLLCQKPGKQNLCFVDKQKKRYQYIINLLLISIDVKQLMAKLFFVMSLVIIIFILNTKHNI